MTKSMKMFVHYSDIDALKSFEYLKTYCESQLGQAKRKGSTGLYKCAFCGHDNPKMELRQRDGHGYAICVANGTQGDVFTVAQALHAGFSFPEAVEHVAQVVGYRLTAQSSGKGGRASQYGRNVRTVGEILPLVTHKYDLGPLKEPTAPRVVFLDEAGQQRARNALARARENREAIEEYAHLLHLPSEALSTHLINDNLPYGMLGLDESLNLCYIYLAKDELGKYKATGLKVRSRPEDIAKGAQRFYMYGKKASLWGAPILDVDTELARVRTVIITEGESDCLAVRYAFYRWLEDIRQNEPDDYPSPELHPVILARPDASTFKPQWALPLKGLDVILTVDNDETGEKKARDVARILQDAGVNQIWAWRAPEGKKDPRAAFNKEDASELFINILTNKQRIETT